MGEVQAAGGSVAVRQLDAVEPRAWRALAVASLGTVLVGFNSTATNIAFGDIADTFDSVSETTVSWIASGYFIGTGAFLPLGGRLADRVGRRKVFLGGLILFAVSAVASAIAPTVWFLIAARVLQSAAGAMVLPSSLALVLPMFPESRRPGAVGLWSAAGPLSSAFAPSISAFFVDLTSWRWLYFATAPAALLIFVAAARLLPDPPVEKAEGRLDLVGAAIGTAAIGLVVIAVSQSVQWGWAVALGLGLIGAAMLALFVRRALRHPQPLVNLQLMKRRDVWVADLANFFISVVALSVWLVWPLFLSRVWDYSTAAVGLAVTIGPVSAGASTVVFSRLSDRHGTRTFIPVGSCFLLASTLWAATRLGAEENYWLDYAPALALFGLGWGMATPLLNSMALGAVEERYWGETNAMFNTTRYVAAAIGTAGAIAIIGDKNRPDEVAAYQRTFLFFSIWLAAAVVLLVAVPHGPRRSSGRDRGG